MVENLLTPKFSRLKKRATAEREVLEKEHERQKALRAQKQRREEETEARRLDKANTKKAAEQEKLKAKMVREGEERKKQEQRWAGLNATTDAEKQQTCLHSEFWPRQQQPRKFKVGVPPLIVLFVSKFLNDWTMRLR